MNESELSARFMTCDISGQGFCMYSAVKQRLELEWASEHVQGPWGMRWSCYSLLCNRGELDIVENTNSRCTIMRPNRSLYCYSLPCSGSFNNIRVAVPLYHNFFAARGSFPLDVYPQYQSFILEGRGEGLYHGIVENNWGGWECCRHVASWTVTVMNDNRYKLGVRS